jgi:hypothetical protein
MPGGRVLAVALAVAGSVLVAPSGWAASSVRAGWWTTTPAPLAPDASAEQLVLQGGVDPAAPVSYAAIAFELDAGEVPTTVRLDVVPNSASTPNAVLTACPLTTAAFDAARGGPGADAPAYDCATSVTAEPRAGELTTYEFGVGAFAASGTLAFAVLATNVADRVVLAVPGASALQSTSDPAATSSDPGFDDSATFDDSASFDSGVGSGGSDFADVPLSDLSTPDLPSLTQLGRSPELAAAARKDVTLSMANQASLANQAALTGSTSEGASWAPLLLGLLALGIGCWAFATRRPRTAP